MNRSKLVLVLGFSWCLGSAAACQELPRAGEPTPAAGEMNRDAAREDMGYYRMPTIHGETIVFVSEGDLWRVGAAGGRATRLTTHPGEERDPAISPDGTMVVFTAVYEGPREVYTMPLGGGAPVRRTTDGLGRGSFVGWADAETILYATAAGTTIPRTRMARHDLGTNVRTILPLDQCAEAVFAGDGRTLVFTRLVFQGSHTDRYRGGTVQQLWRFTVPDGEESGAEATILTGDYPGASRRPLWWDGRVYFTSDRDGFMNIWSMRADGSDVKQHTSHAGKDIGSSGVHDGRIVYQLGPDLRLLDVRNGQDAALTITLDSDLDQTREKWVKKPASYLTAAHISPTGDRVALTARGKVFVAPVKQGRLVEADAREGIRYRDARFMPDGKTLVALSDESGEVEVVTLQANGVGGPEPRTSGGQKLRWKAIPSPDGKWIAHTDKDQRLWVHDAATKSDSMIEQNSIDQIDDLAWSADSRYLAYVAPAANLYRRVKVWDSTSGVIINITTDRYDSFSPQWSTDGKWLYFLSDRTFKTFVNSPWGPRAPEPFLDKATRVYLVALKPGQRSPFTPEDEVYLAQKEAEKGKEKKQVEPADAAKAGEEAAGAAPQPADTKPGTTPTTLTTLTIPTDPAKPDAEKKDSDAAPEVKVEIDADGIGARIDKLPAPAGNYASLMLTEKAVFWLSFDALAISEGDGGPTSGTLQALAIGHEKPEVKTVVDGVTMAELSADHKKFLLRKGDALHVIPAEPAKAELEKSAVDLTGWTLSVDPRLEWRQMFVESWRLLRDYFYDRDMHGVDWRAVLEKYLPTVDRVRSREELADLMTELTGELSALHHFVRPGDVRSGQDEVTVGLLGADWVRDAAAGGYRLLTIHLADADEPWTRSPLREPHVDVRAGDVILAVNGVPTLSTPDPALLLRQQAGKQVLLSVSRAAGGEAAGARDVIVTPLTPAQDTELRYRAWEVQRRQVVEQAGAGDIGYLHLRAMGQEDYADFARDYYPVFDRKGLIIDVRDNRGGNIDSWVLARLMRKAWMYWNQHSGRQPLWNMQFAFRGHMVVLCNERTASDGEAFSEGFKRLGLGKVIGTRTWGGEIWLSSSNLLVDNGIASAGEFGVFGPEGTWLIEGHGVEPDLVVDNPPHETFRGEDRQLNAAIEHLKKLIREEPVDVPPVPQRPNKRFPPR